MSHSHHLVKRLATPTIAVCILALLLPTATRLAHADQPDPQPSAATHTLYLPIGLFSPGSHGFVTTPAELRAAKARADQGSQPSHDAVVVTLRAADEALDRTPCAVAAYTTDSGADCLNHSAQDAYVLAMAYHLTLDRRYADQSAAIIRAWYTTLVTIDQDDSQARLDWSRMAPALVWAADLLESTPAWNQTDRPRFTAMLVNKVLAQGQEASKRANNWGDAGNLLRITIAVYAGLPDERAAAIANWKRKLDGVLNSDGSWDYGMLPDGSLPEENRRGADGLGYNQGALSSKTVFAEIVRRQSDSSLYTYTTPRGVGLKNGWDFLAQHVVDAEAGRCGWPYTKDHCVDYANKSAWEIAYAYWHAQAYLGPIELKRPYQWADWADPGYSTLLFGDIDLDGA